MRAWRRFGRVGAACVAWLLIGSGASAEYHRRVLLLERASADERDHEVTTRVRAELSAVQEGIPDAIPLEACYLGWQESLMLLCKLVEAEIPDE